MRMCWWTLCGAKLYTMCYIFVANCAYLSSPFCFAWWSAKWQRSRKITKRHFTWVHGHSRSLNLSSIERALCDFLLGVNSNIGHIYSAVSELRRLDESTYWSKICFWALRLSRPSPGVIPWYSLCWWTLYCEQLLSTD